ncbi:hypothetical protein X737_24400 [Mesorhizobium sp. L48C026A00]|nr:hypothetical protein X737_24400 [Mesorhizobium sp. L48C026A00]
MGAIDVMVSALSGIYLSSCGIIGSIFGSSARFITASPN